MAMETAISIMMAGTSFTFVYMALNISQKHGILGWLFLPFGVLTSFVSMFLLAEHSGSAAVQNILYTYGYGIFIIFMMIIFYLLIYIITDSFEKLLNRENKYKNTLGK